MDEEGLKDTANEMIHIGHPIEMDDEWFEEKLKLLDKVSRQDSASIHIKKQNKNCPLQDILRFLYPFKKGYASPFCLSRKKLHLYRRLAEKIRWWRCQRV